ncbi:MAG: pyridoxamine 5'-phosphate oxidase, partial [Caulobacterales bacterium]
MKNKPLIPASPSEDDYVRKVAHAESLPLLPDEDPIALFEAWLREALKA